MKSTTIVATTVCALISSIGISQNVKEAVQDHTQIKTGKTSLDRDAQELEAFKADCDVLTKALATDDTAIIAQYHQVVLASMKREVEQAEVKSKKAAKEVVQSTAEMGTNRREKRGNRRTYSGTADDKRDMARDRRNTRDDRRDKRDDQTDRVEISERLRNQRLWTAQFSSLSLSQDTGETTDEAALALLKKFTLSMEADLRETQEELREDKGELREDRRERRDDRKERKERVTQ